MHGSKALLQKAQPAIVSIVLAALAVFALFSVFQTVERVVDFYTPLPFWDYWRTPENLNHYEAHDISAFWRQHNEHRIIFPEIVFALDSLWLHGRLLLPLAVSFLCYLSAWAILCGTVLSQKQVSIPVRLAAAFLTGIIVFWKGAAQLLAAPFQLQWTLLQLATVASLFFAAQVAYKNSNRYLIACIASALIANYSSGNGLLIWPVLILAALVLQFSRAQLSILITSAALSVGVYFIGYKSSSALNTRDLITHPFYLLGFIGTYLATPFSLIKTPAFGVSVGLINLAVTILLSVVAFRKQLLRSRSAILLFGSYLFTLLTILLTAAGRMDAADPTFLGAKPSRYITVPLLNWAVVILICFWLSYQSHSRVLQPALTAIFSILLAISLPKLRSWLSEDADAYALQQLAGLSIVDGIFDPTLLKLVFPVPEFVANYTPELREQSLSTYYKSREKWLGKPVDSYSAILPTPISGEISYTFPVRSGFEVVGWADNPGFRHGYDWLVLANDSKQIVGFGRRLPAGFPLSLHSPTTPPMLAWVGFVNLSTPTSEFSAYVVDPRRAGLYPIPGSQSVPFVQAATSEEAGAPISGVTWKADSTWSLNRLPTSVKFGQIPTTQPYASWSGNDANTGTLLSSFTTPADGCVILPVLHGPRVAGLSLVVRDADTKQIVSTAPLQNGRTQWEYWRLPFQSIRHIQMEAIDAGKDWGEWLAVATPTECR